MAGQVGLTAALGSTLGGLAGSIIEALTAPAYTYKWTKDKGGKLREQQIHVRPIYPILLWAFLKADELGELGDDLLPYGYGPFGVGGFNPWFLTPIGTMIELVGAATGAEGADEIPTGQQGISVGLPDWLVSWVNGILH